MPGSPVVTVEFARSARARRRRFASTAPLRPATSYIFCSPQCGQHTRATDRPPRLSPADRTNGFAVDGKKRNVVGRRHAYIYIYIRIRVFYFWLVLAHSLVRPIVIPPSRTLAPTREIRPAQRAPHCRARNYRPLLSGAYRRVTDAESRVHKTEILFVYFPNRSTLLRARPVGFQIIFIRPL